MKGDPLAGDEVEVVDHKMNPIGRGFFNPFSQYKVRMMTRSHESIYSEDMESVLKTRYIYAVYPSLLLYNSFLPSLPIGS